MLQQFDQLYAQFKEAGVDNEATFGGYRLVYINVPEEDRPRRKRTHDIELYLPGETTNPLRSVRAARAHLSGTVDTPMSATEAPVYTGEPGATVAAAADPPPSSATEAGAEAPSLAMDEDGDEAGSAGELENWMQRLRSLWSVRHDKLWLDRPAFDSASERLYDLLSEMDDRLNGDKSDLVVAMAKADGSDWEEYPLDGYDTLEYFPTELDDLHSLVVEAMYAVEEEAAAWQRIPPFPEESDLEDAASPPNAHPRRTRLEMMHLREFHHHRRLVSKAVGRLLSTSLPDYSAELDAALRRIVPTRPVRRTGPT